MGHLIIVLPCAAGIFIVSRLKYNTSPPTKEGAVIRFTTSTPVPGTDHKLRYARFCEHTRAKGLRPCVSFPDTTLSDDDDLTDFLETSWWIL